jgi:hypothetical protein
MNNKIKIISFVFTFIGLVATVIGSILIINTINFKSKSIETTGIVVDSLTYNRNNKGNITSLDIKFTDNNNEEVLFSSSPSGQNNNYEIGDEIEILYSEKDSAQAKINKFANLWVDKIIILGIGIIFLIIGFILLKKHILS